MQRPRELKYYQSGLHSAHFEYEVILSIAFQGSTVRLYLDDRTDPQKSGNVTFDLRLAPKTDADGEGFGGFHSIWEHSYHFHCPELSK